MPCEILALQFLYGADTGRCGNSRPPLSTEAGKGWRPFGSPGCGYLDFFPVANSNIVDLRAGVFCSINVPPSSTVTSPPLQVQKYRTYRGFYNVAVAHGSSICIVEGGSANDVSLSKVEKIRFCNADAVPALHNAVDLFAKEPGRRTAAYVLR